MPDYFVTIKETNTHAIKVTADTPQEACERASDMFGGGVPPDTTVDTIFESVEAIDMGVLRCHRCGSPVDISHISDYSFYCPECDEDLYQFEVKEAEKNV